MLPILRKLLRLSSDNPPTSASGEDYRKRADACLGQGEIAAAEEHYRHAIALDPRNAKAYVGLGFIETERRNDEAAEALLKQALALSSDNAGTGADAHYMLGKLPPMQSAPEQACAHFRQAIALNPHLEIAYLDLCQILLALGQAQEARHIISSGVDANPASVDLLFYLGNLHFEINDFEHAIACFEKALAIQADRSDVQANLGLALLKNKAPAKAAHYLQLALAQHPRVVDLYNNLGNAMHAQGEYDQAIAIYEAGLAIDEHSARLHNNLGYALQAQNKFEPAIASYRQALAIAPDDVDVYVNLGSALKSQGRVDEALACYRNLIARAPRHSDAFVNLGNILLETGRLDLAIEQYDLALGIGASYQASNNKGSALMMLGRFDEAVACYENAVDANPDFAAAQSSLLFTLNYMPDRSAGEMLQAAQRFGKLAQRLATPYRTWQVPPRANRRLRIGFVSGELRSGPVGFFAESIFKALASAPSAACDLIAYYHHTSQDAVSARIKASCREWHDVAALNDESLARKIHDDRIDVLIDLAGHTAHNRLPVFAWKPAPVQISWLGYFATTGVRAIDYLIADPWTLPESEESNFSENIWRLPETRLCFTAPEVDIAVSPLPALSNGYLTFGCFNNLLKMNAATVALWSRILSALPTSKLFLKAGGMQNEVTQLQTIERFAAHGIARERLILEGPQQRADYLAAYHRVDIALDPFPYTGGATSAETLWMGVPIITLAGESFLSRQGVGLLANAGLSDWIAETREQYVEMAKQHAANLQDLAQLRATLRRQVLDSPIFDAPRFARHFEAVLEAMWDRWYRQQAE